MRSFFQNLRLLSRVASGRPRLVLLLFISCGAATLASLLPTYATSGIIRTITERNFQGIFPYCLLYFVTYATYFLCLRTNSMLYTSLAEYFHVKNQRKIFRTISTVPEVLKKNPRGRITDTFSDDIRWVVDAINSAVNIIIYLIQLAVIFVIFVRCDWKTGLLAIAIDVLYIIILAVNAHHEALGYAAARRQEDRAIGAFNELVSHKLAQIERQETSPDLKIRQKDILPTHIDKSCESKMNSSFTPWRRAYEKKRIAIVNRTSLWAAVPYLGKLLLYILLAKMVIDGAFRLDTLVLIIGYFEMTISVMDKLATSLLNFADYGVRLSRIECLISDTPERCRI